MVCSIGDSTQLKVCSNDNPRLTLSCLTAMSNFATLAFIWENVIMMDVLEIVAAFDMEVG